MLFEFNVPFEEFWGLTLRQKGALTMSYATLQWATPHLNELCHTPHCMMSFRVVYSMEPLLNYTGVNLSLFRLRNIFQRIQNQIWKTCCESPRKSWFDRRTNRTKFFRCDACLTRKKCTVNGKCIKLNKFQSDDFEKYRGNMFPFTLTFKINQLWLSDMDTLRRCYDPGV
jgi:hypothetical protein